VSLRARHPLLYLAALACGATVFFALSLSGGTAAAQVAPPTTASFTAGDNFWDWTGGTGTIAEIATGGTVTFSDPAGETPPHNVDFTGSQEPACTGIPADPINTGWNGSCSFNSPGAYPFVCEAHAEMTGRVDVVDVPGQPPPPGGNPPGGNPPGGNPPGGNPPGGGDPPGGSPTQPNAPRITFARRQTGTTLRGSVTAAAGAKVVVSALVSNRSLSNRRPKTVKKVKVGSQTKRSSGAKINFAVRLNAAARRALKRRGKLAVTLRIVVTPPGGKATIKTVAVKVRAL
jgi:hypothetical protein